MEELRVEPRFSVNKLAEYLAASARRRRRLILDQIKAVVYKTGLYGRARSSLTRFICDPSSSVDSLRVTAIKLRDRAGQREIDPFDARCLRASARAIESFVPIAEDFRYEEAIATPGARRGILEVAGVEISVAPEVAIIAPGTERLIGGVKFHFGATFPLTQIALQYAAAMLFRYIEVSGGTPLQKLCDAVDVFAATYESAPRAIKRRLEDVEAACEEIAERWPMLRESFLQQRST